jgi:hypothetical protein
MSIEALSWALKQELDTPAQKLVLVALANHADGYGWCWPRQRYLAATACIRRESCCKVIGELEARGLIRRVREARRGARPIVHYQLLMDIEFGGDEACEARARPPRHTRHQLAPSHTATAATPAAADDGPAYELDDEELDCAPASLDDVAEGMGEPAVAQLAAGQSAARSQNSDAREGCDLSSHGCDPRTHIEPSGEPSKGFYDEPYGGEAARKRESTTSQTPSRVEPVIVVEGAALADVEKPNLTTDRGVWLARLREAQALCAPVLDRTGANLETWVTFRLLCDPASGGSCDWELDVVPALVSLTAWCAANGKQIRRWDSVERGAKLNRDKRLASIAAAKGASPAVTTASASGTPERRAILVQGFANDWIDARDLWAHAAPPPTLDEVVCVLRTARRGDLLRSLQRLVDAGDLLWPGARP